MRGKEEGIAQFFFIQKEKVYFLCRISDILNVREKNGKKTEPFIVYNEMDQT